MQVVKKLSNEVYIIDKFWTIEKCNAFISKAEEIGFEPAKVETETGVQVVSDARNNDRIIKFKR